MYSCYTELFEIELFICITMDLALNNLQRLICHKTQTTNPTWEKTTDDFDVTMGSFDCAQIADLEGIYIFDTLGRFLNLNNDAIYRDDGLIFTPNSNRPLTSKIQKKSVEHLNIWG